MKTVLEVGALIQDAQHIVDGPAYLVMADGLIESTGAGTYPGDPAAVQRIKRPHSLAIPGLVNAHGHAAMTLLRGAGDDLPLHAWLEQRIFPLEAKLTEEAVYWGTLLACWEMLRSGTTCFVDMYFFMHEAAAAVAESGLRGVLSWGMVGLDDGSRRQAMAHARSFVTRWHGAANGRITTTLGPHAPYTCPPDFLREVAALSAELDVPVQIHLAETRREVAECLEQYGCTPIQLVERCGLCTRPLLAAHCVHVTDADIELMQQHDIRVAHNPQSNLKLASGVAPVPRLLQAGVTVGLGTDGAASNNNLDLFEELRLAATLHKGVSEDATLVPAAAAFHMATAAGARCAFLPPNSGRLAPGCTADVVLLDMQSPHFVPGHHRLSDVVYAAGADDVTDVWVAGQQVLAGREPVTLDTERVRYEVIRLRERLTGPGN
ncbi:MAG: amidohydrolase [Alicyclobacillus sp.]|nr:amidohydrolase [Alicyclobacillus sp.]